MRRTTRSRKGLARKGLARKGLAALVCLTALLGAAAPATAADKEDPDIVHGWQGFTDVKNSLYHHISSLAYDLIDEREKVVAALETAEDWKARRAAVRKTLADLVGPFPEKTPLNARIVGTLERDDFRVEKLIFESRPGFPVTGAVFVPKGVEGRVPAILYVSGHSGNAFRYTSYQHIIMNLVKKGFIVFAIDPVGQGERVQYYDPVLNRSKVGSPTKEHSYPGAQMILTGDNIARTMIWDGIRAVDYLLTRPDVDPERIGITGRSGGGTQSVYIGALDDRIAAAAPGNWVTTFRRIFQSIGPQDAEQNIRDSLARGIDIPDMLLARAPKDTLIVATTRDFFNIQGVYDAVDEMRRAYAALGRPDAIQITEDDAGHTSTSKNREATFRFFLERFGVDGDPTDEPTESFDEKELYATVTGQVVTSVGGETLFTLNKARAERLAAERDAARKTGDAQTEATLRAAKQLSRYRPPGEPGPTLFNGRYQRDGYAYEKYSIKGEGDYVVPFFLLLPHGDGPFPVVIALHPEGRMDAIRRGGTMEALVRKGYAVLSPDLIGTGETGPGVFKGDAYGYRQGTGAYNIWFGAQQVGRSLVGIRAGDVNRLVKYLQGNPKIDAGRIAAVAEGRMGPVLLHAAAFEPAIGRIALMDSLATYDSIVMHEYYKPELIHATVPGALTAYDLPDLAATLAPRPLLLAGAVDHYERPLDTEAAGDAYAATRQAYAASGAKAAFLIEDRATGNRADRLLAWLRGD